MKHLFKEWDFLAAKLRQRIVFIFLDFDGTLAPIVSRPEDAVLPKQVRQLLEKLCAVKRYKIAIVSGRALADVKKRVGIKGIVYCANHGLELEGPKIKHVFFTVEKFRRLLDEIAEAVNGICADFPGAQLEDKGLTLSIHYRRVDPKAAVAMRTAVRQTLIHYTVKGLIRLKKGKKVFEVRPPVEWDKGKVVLWLIARWKALCAQQKTIAVYLGDDVTDEDAFRALRGKGLTVFVGSLRRTAAEYYLDGPGQVREFLQKLLALEEQQP